MNQTLWSVIGRTISLRKSEPCRGTISVENLALVKRIFFFSFLMLLTLINWLPTHAEAQARTVAITGPAAANGEFQYNDYFQRNCPTGFARTDITVSGGTSTGTLQGSGAVYTMTIRPAASSSRVRVSIQADVVDRGQFSFEQFGGQY